MIDPDQVIGVAAQIQNDEITLPIVAVTRDGDYEVDTARTNFTRIHKGVATVIDPATNDLYYERVIPILLGYNLTILTNNTVDMDELVRELMFKYTSMYFLTITVPYESKRSIRFGITQNLDKAVSRTSGSSEYLKQGTLYQTIIPLKCDGCVLVNYVPAKLKAGQPANAIPTSSP